MKRRTIADVERDLRFARANHELVNSDATARHLAQLERERASMVVLKRDAVQKFTGRR